MTMEERYQAAIKKIGGTAGLLNLPKEIRKILKETTDLETKAEMLEMIAEAKKEA